MSLSYCLIVSTLIGLAVSQSTQQPMVTPTPTPTPTTTSFDGYTVCLSIVNSALQTLNATFELQSSTINVPFDLNLLPVNCFYLKSPEVTCRQSPTGLSDMFSMMLWVTQLIEQCNIPGSWVGYPETIDNLNQGIRQFSLGTSGSAGPMGSLGVGGSVGTNGLSSMVNGQMGTNGLSSMVNGQMGNYGQGSAMMSAGAGGGNIGVGASGTPMMMVPVQAGISAVPPNPFSTMMGIIGSSVGPQGITISPATIAGILSLINQVVGIAVQLAPIGGAVAGPLLAGALG